MSGEEVFFPYNSVSLIIGGDDVTLVAICRGVRLWIQAEIREAPVSAPKSEAFQARLRQFLNSIDDDPGAITDLENFLIQPCFDCAESLLRSKRPRRDQSLQEYFFAPTVAFELKTIGNRLDVVMTSCDEASTEHLTPQVSWNLLRKILPSERETLCISSSQAQIIRDPEISDWDLYEMPRLVQVRGWDGPLFFKAVVDEDSLLRELDVLTRIDKIDPFHRLKTSRLVGVVRRDDTLSVIGVLIECIPGARNLNWAMDDATPELGAIWMQQLENTLAKLHESEIIWGDVKPENIVIDSKNEAWIVDFGGGFSPHWVSEERQGTREGDREGLANIARALGFSSR